MLYEIQIVGHPVYKNTKDDSRGVLLYSLNSDGRSIIDNLDRHGYYTMDTAAQPQFFARAASLRRARIYFSEAVLIIHIRRTRTLSSLHAAHLWTTIRGRVCERRAFPEKKGKDTFSLNLCVLLGVYYA